MIDYQVCHYRDLISKVRKLPVLRGKIYFYMQILVFISTSRRSTHRVEIDNFILIMIYYIIFSINFVKNNLFSQKLKQFLKLFFIYLSENIYHHFIIWIYLIIHFLGGPYFDKLCYHALYFSNLFFLCS